jgi:putative ABC transport system permease protein
LAKRASSPASTCAWRPAPTAPAVLRSWPCLATNTALAEPGDAAQRISNLSRAYRVNLTVLALVALFTGAFLVFSVLALSVAQRAQQFALLGVLGAHAAPAAGAGAGRVAGAGLVGSAPAWPLGTALAGLALRLLGGDLGGGYFAGVAPNAAVDGPAALALRRAGRGRGGRGWLVARRGPHSNCRRRKRSRAWAPPGRAASPLAGPGVCPADSCWRLLAWLAPPVFGLPLGSLRVGWPAAGGRHHPLLPWDGLAVRPPGPRGWPPLLPMLAMERARRVRGSAAVAVSGVVASLSLAVALTVMVASFRESVTQWLDVVLPAELYVRTAPDRARATRRLLPRVRVGRGAPARRAAWARCAPPLQLDPARAGGADCPCRWGAPLCAALPLVGAALPVPEGWHVGVYVSEAVVDLYGAAARAGLLARFPGISGPRKHDRQAGTRYLFCSRRVARLCPPVRATVPWTRPTSSA